MASRIRLSAFPAVHGRHGPRPAPGERGGAITFKVLAIFVFGLIAAGLGALALTASLARKQKQRTLGEDFGLLVCAGLASGAAAFALGLLLAGLGA